jgi:hypothetical protein
MQEVDNFTEQRPVQKIAARPAKQQAQRYFQQRFGPVLAQLLQVPNDSDHDNCGNDNEKPPLILQNAESRPSVPMGRQLKKLADDRPGFILLHVDDN